MSRWEKNYGQEGRFSGDPINSHLPRGKNRSMRKGSRDGGLTPTEQARKQKLMRQFLQVDGPKGASPEYLQSVVWCPGCNGRRMRAEGLEHCESCQEAVNAIQ